MGLFDAFLTKNKTASVNDSTINFSALTSNLVQGKKYSLSDVESSETTINTLDEDEAMKIGALYQGLTIICDTIASLPLYLYKGSDGFDEILDTDPRSIALTHQANDILSAFNLKRDMLKDLILYGNAYAKIDRSEGKVNLIYLPNSVVTPKKDNAGYYFEVQGYSTDVNGENYPSEVVNYEDMFVLVKNNAYNSITGTGLLDYASDMFAMSSEETKYMYGLLSNGLSAKAILSVPNAFKREIKNQLRSDIKEFYSGANNSGKLMIMEGDVRVIPLNLTPTDLKLIENKNFTISEISRFLNIPKHMLNLDRQQGTYSNITQERLQLLTNTLTPYVTIIEQEANKKLLEDNELEQGYYFAFDTAELMKMTPEDQSAYMLKLFEQNVVTIEEVRSALGLGGDAETIAQLKNIQYAKTQNVINTYNQQGVPEENTEDEKNNSEGNSENKGDSKEQKPSEEDKEKDKNKKTSEGGAA